MENSGHFATFDAVVSLLEDLELIMNSPKYVLGSDESFSSPFRKEDIQILFNKISSMHSSLCDSSGLSYDKELMDRWGHWIRLVVSLAQEYIDSWVWSCAPQPKMEKESGRMSSPKLHRMAESMEFMNMQLKMIQYREGLGQSSNNLQGATFTGQPFTVLDMSSIIPERGDRSAQDDISHLLNFMPFALLKGDGTMCDNLREIHSFLKDREREGYDQKMINSLESLIGVETRIAKDIILDPWEHRYVSEDPRRYNIESGTIGLDRLAQISDTSLCQITESTRFINKQLKEIRDVRDILKKPISTGKVYNKKSTKWIKDVVDTAQDYLDAWVWSCLNKTNAGKPRDSGIYGAAQILNQKLCRITETLEFIHKQLKRSHDNREVLRPSTQNLLDKTSAGPSFVVSNMLPKTPNDECKLVGLEDDLVKMLDCLTRKSSKLEVFAVTGMGGIGKTTFTKRLYDHPFLKHHFDIRAWFTISQHYQLREVLIGLRRCITGSDTVTGIYESDHELKDKLYKSLKGMRFLIVLDDMWDKKVWDDLKIIFPDDKSDSRIILTSRLEDVATHASQNTHCLRCLNDDESWELLCSKISMEECCPELLLIGKQIAFKCQGLPLAIVVVGGLLSKMNKKLDMWKDVAQSVSSKVMKESNYCENVLALSYNHLPDHLKTCFLYMGTFPEDHKILAKKLMRLWIVEGFVRPGNLKSVEEVAENYLEDLIARSLIQVKRKSSGGKIKICYIHDLLRDLCLKESHKQNFYLAFNKHGQLTKPSYGEFQLEPRRICFPSTKPDLIISPLFPPIRSFLWFQAITLSDPESYFFMNFKLLKVLDITYLHLKELPREILYLANLRYLALSFRKSIDRSIFSPKFHNLQFLIVEGKWNGLLPKEFWDMSEIRHFHLKRSFASYWPKESRPSILQLAPAELPQDIICQVQYEDYSLNVLQNLQSLTTIRPISCTEAVFITMPILKKLGVYECEEDIRFQGWFKDLIHLKKLQTLKYTFRDPFVGIKPDRLPSQDFILVELMNLTLSGTSFPWEDTLRLCALPKLEVLKLKNYAFFGTTWTLEGGGFPRLKYLLIGTTNLQSWNADGTHFPMLQHLVMMKCLSLKEIPHGIGEAPLLEKIELHNCSESAATSARQIQQEQLDNGYDGLTIHIT